MGNERNSKGSALITGGPLRLGRAMALHLAENGWNAALHYNSSADAARATQAEIERRGVRCSLFQCDFRRPETAEGLIAEARSVFPDLRLLINSASTYRAGRICDTDGALLDEMLNVNLKAPYLLARAFARECETGSVINIIDNKIAFNQHQYSAYLLSKSALAEFTRQAALEFAPRIRVNGISPGVVLPASDRSAPYIAWRLEGIPLRRKGELEHIVQTLQFILDNDFVTGQIFTIDGGESLGDTGRNAVLYQELEKAERLNRFIVAVGSNINQEENVKRAREIIANEHRLLDESRFILTAPVGFQDQDDFLNGAFLIESELDIARMKEYLKDAENRLGRVRLPIKSGPRTMDLDIIAWNDLVIHDDYYAQEYISGPVDELAERRGIRLQHMR